MCGICGVIGYDAHHEQTHAMTQRLIHRGPDEAGFYTDADFPLSLGMRRLAIVDPQTGHQPYYNEDGQVVVIFNGEIFNAPQWRRRLEQAGHVFHTDHCDGEVIVHLYEENGPSFVKELNGMFAIALWDRRRRLLVLARDPFGIKPLFYRWDQNGLVFASEIKALRVLPHMSQEIDRQALSHYLSLQYIPAPWTIYSEIRKLPAGWMGVYRLDEKDWITQRYWRLDVGTKITLDPQQAEEKILFAFDEAVRRWSLSDVPLAVSLSGGLDSSGLAVSLKRSGFSFETYTVGFMDKKTDLDESSLARRLAGFYGWPHHERFVDPSDLLDDLPQMIQALDEPYAGGLPSWFIYKTMASRVEVAMTGTGGDELFGNYGKGSLAVRPFWWRWMRDQIKHSLFGSGRLKDYSQFPLTHHYPLFLTQEQKQRWLVDCPPFMTEAMIEDLARGAQGADPRDRIAYVDMQLQLPEEFLMMTDRFSMYFSIEARVPFLDKEFVEQIFLLPAGVRAPLGDPKRFWRRCLAQRLPQDYLHAPKRGFVLPLGVWMRTVMRSLIEELFDRDFLRRQALFAPNLRDELIAPFLNGRNNDTETVWTFVMFQLWWRLFVSTDLEKIKQKIMSHADFG